MLGLILLIIVILLLVGSFPSWPYMAPYNWGYGPTGILGLILIIILVLFLFGRI
jgi:hypothetical protein